MLPSRTDFWGSELTAKKKEAIWDAEVEDDPPGELDIVHTLHIQRVILGANAKEENHLVTITAENVVGEEITHPLCWLSKKSVSESQCSMHMALSPPVTLRLAQGSGPVHVVGVWEQQLEDEEASYSSDEEDLADNTMDSIDSKPIKNLEEKQKKRPASSPPAKPAKVAKRDEKISKPAPIQKKLVTKVEQESDEDDEEEEEEESIDEEDEDDEEDVDGENEEDEDEEEEEEESEDEPAPPPKKKVQSKVVTPKQKANTPKSIGDKAARKPGKVVTPQVSRSLDELKAMLAKSPNVPKKREKFNNYLQNNLKVTDPDVKNKLWNFVQQSKH